MIRVAAQAVFAVRPRCMDEILQSQKHDNSKTSTLRVCLQIAKYISTEQGLKVYMNSDHSVLFLLNSNRKDILMMCCLMDHTT